MHVIRLALRYIVSLDGNIPARQFGPKRLKLVREVMVKADYCRTSINKLVGCIKRMFRWAVENEYVTPEVHAALAAVAGLKRGRAEARESKPVKPVAEGTVSNTLAYLTPTVTAMVQLQLLTGARPGEVCKIRPCNVTIQTNGVWVYRPEGHKTEHFGKERRIYIGQEWQKVLRPFLDREPEAFCFSPAESEAERNAERRKNRSSPMTLSQASRKPKAHRGSPRKTTTRKIATAGQLFGPAERPALSNGHRTDYDTAGRPSSEKSTVSKRLRSFSVIRTPARHRFTRSVTSKWLLAL